MKPTVAIIGASSDRSKYGNKSVRAHLQQGYEVYPVHPRESIIEGLPAYRSVLDVPVATLDRISVYLPPALGLQIIDEIARKPAREVWFNPGAESPALVARARTLGVNAIVGCSIIAVGMSLLGRARFPRWYWLTFNFGTLFGVGFCTWLQFQSLYRINALCLWCSLAWVATIIMFWYVTSFNVRNGFLPGPAWLKSFFGEFTWVLPAVHIGVIGMLILTRWWDFWTS